LTENSRFLELAKRYWSMRRIFNRLERFYGRGDFWAGCKNHGKS
jgi:hypothetical protein